MPISRIEALWTQTQRAITPAYNDHVIMVVNNGFFNSYGQAWTGSALVFPTDIKYVLEIECEGGLAGSVILKKTTSFNEDFIAYFHVESVIQDFLDTDIEEYYSGNSHLASNISSIHLITNLSKNKANLRRFTFKVRCEFIHNNIQYSSGNFTMPDNSADGKKFYNQDYYFWNAVADKLDGETFQHITDYYVTGSNKKTLTTFPTGSGSPVQKIQKSQHHTVGFFCGGHRDHTTDSFALADVSSVRVTTFNTSGAQVEQNTLTNSDANGGAAPVAGQFFSTSGNSTRGQNGLLYFGSGAKNLTDAGAITASNLVVGATYRVEFLESDNSQAYEPLEFEIVEDDCKGFETIRLMWLNTLGTWDYFNFTKLSTQTYSSNRATYKQNYGHETTHVADGWGSNTHLGGTQVFNNTITQTIEANTDFITEEEATFLKGCFTSPLVQWQTLNSRGSYRFVPVVVKEKDYIVRTNANDKLIQYVIELEVGHDYRVQRT